MLESSMQSRKEWVRCEVITFMTGFMLGLAYLNCLWENGPGLKRGKEPVDLRLQTGNLTRWCEFANINSTQETIHWKDKSVGVSNSIFIQSTTFKKISQWLEDADFQCLFRLSVNEFKRQHCVTTDEAWRDKNFTLLIYYVHKSTLS